LKVSSGSAKEQGAHRTTEEWVVVGAGPAGIAAVGKLLDCKTQPGSIVWIDPQFRVGDFGAKWNQVPSNTTVWRFLEYIRSCDSFGIGEAISGFDIHSMDPYGTCILKDVVEPLQWITNSLVKIVPTIRSEVTLVRPADNVWLLQTPARDLRAKNVILAIGAEPRRLPYPVPAISLEDAFDCGRLKKAVCREDAVGVFGSSHSAILAIRNLLDVGVGRVINFSRSLPRYAVDYGDWILYDNTGLKGETAEWVRQEMPKVPEDRLLRVGAGDGTVRRFLPQCTKVVYGVGFEPRRLRVEGADPTKYDQTNGIIAPGLFGCGIAFPERVVDRAGNVELNVGILKFAKFLNRVVPIWLGGKEHGS